MSEPDVLSLLARPVAFHPFLAQMCGSISAGILLSQAMYWSKRTKDPDGWFWKTREEWHEETGLNRTEQEEARTKLRATGFWLEVRKGNPAKLFYRVDMERLTEFVRGNRPELTVPGVIKACRAALTGLSRSGLMRAKKMGVTSEYVDYAKVLELRGLICGICKGTINRPVGQKPDFLAFDHIIPLSKNGSHVFTNIQPTHFLCNGLKGNAPSSRPVVSHQEGLSKPNLSDASSPTPRARPSDLTESKTEKRVQRAVVSKQIPEEPPQIPPPFTGQDFLQVLSEFEAFRKRQRKPLIGDGRVRMFATFEIWGEKIATEALGVSVMNSYMGVSLPKTNGFNGNGNGAEPVRQKTILEQMLARGEKVKEGIF